MQPFLSHWPKPVKAVVFRLAGIHQGNQVLERAWREDQGAGRLITRLLANQGVTVTVEGMEHLEGLTAPGVLIAGNHPHGLIDALALASLAEQSGREFTMLARHFLTIFERLRPHLIPLQVDARQRAANGRQQFHAAVTALEQGKAVIITPGGRLSLPPAPGQPAEDPPWRTGVVRMARAAQVPILPVTIQLTVPNWVYRLHAVHPIVRSIAQVLRLLRRHPEYLTLRLHAPVWPQDLPADDQEAIRQLQTTVCGQATANRR